MKIVPGLIPRFNKDYNLNDFLYSIRSTLRKGDVELKPLHKIFGNKNFFFVNTGRTSLYVILRWIR